MLRKRKTSNKTWRNWSRRHVYKYNSPIGADCALIRGPCVFLEIVSLRPKDSSRRGETHAPDLIRAFPALVNTSDTKSVKKKKKKNKKDFLLFRLHRPASIFSQEPNGGRGAGPGYSYHFSNTIFSRLPLPTAVERARAHTAALCGKIIDEDKK